MHIHNYYTTFSPLCYNECMKKTLDFLKKEPMLTVSVLAATISLFITPPKADFLTRIDWHTLGTLFMMLCVLEGFKQENIFRPVIRFGTKFKTMTVLSLFLIFGVFFSSMFVTNDVSLIIFVPLTILLFRAGGKEHYILPVITLENIAAIRGSLLMPFGSPQNLFLFEQSGISAGRFILMMSPLCVTSGILLILFLLFFFRKNPKEEIIFERNTATGGEWDPKRKIQRIGFLILFALIIWTIVSRTRFWPIAIAIVIITIAFLNLKLFIKVDYVLLVTFFCFFIFSSAITGHPKVSEFLRNVVTGHEYPAVLILSQFISNVPATIVLYPFSESLSGLIYGADTAGLCSLIGSLASVINYRIYVREYPKGGKQFIKTFTLISWVFFLIVVIPGFLLSVKLKPLSETGTQKTDSPSIGPETVSEQSFENLSEVPSEVLSGFADKESPYDESLSEETPELSENSIVFSTIGFNGKKIESADLFKNHTYTMIYIWSTYSDYSIDELPDLEKASSDFAQYNCQIIGVCGDVPYDASSDEMKYAAMLTDYTKISFPTLYAWDSLFEDFPCDTYPTAYFVNAAGEIVGEPIVSTSAHGYRDRLHRLMNP